MSTRKIQRLIEVKQDNKWTQTDVLTDEKEIYDSLTHDLIAKKLCGCSWIKSIKRTQHYDGYITVTVTYNNSCRALYTVTDK